MKQNKTKQGTKAGVATTQPMDIRGQYDIIQASADVTEHTLKRQFEAMLKDRKAARALAIKKLENTKRACVASCRAEVDRLVESDTSLIRIAEAFTTLFGVPVTAQDLVLRVNCNWTIIEEARAKGVPVRVPVDLAFRFSKMVNSHELQTLERYCNAEFEVSNEVGMFAAEVSEFSVHIPQADAALSLVPRALSEVARIEELEREIEELERNKSNAKEFMVDVQVAAKRAFLESNPISEAVQRKMLQGADVLLQPHRALLTALA